MKVTENYISYSDYFGKINQFKMFLMRKMINYHIWVINLQQILTTKLCG